MSWIIALLILSALIFFHELGHYSAARFFGVYVEVFSIGFGKKIASFNWLGTKWQISAIPLGGYVKMKGQDDMDPTIISNDNDSYNSKKPWQRIIILLAGPLANFLLAWFLFYAIALGGPKALSPVIGAVSLNSPASIAGLQKNDRILSINGEAITQWNELSDFIMSSKGHLTLQVQRDNTVQFIILSPRISESTNMFKEKIYKRMVGIAPSGETHTLNLTLMQGFAYASKETIASSLMIFQSVQKLITGVVPTKELGGVVSIVKITADATAYGWMSLFFFAALISVNLGVLNLLPIPALDGGHIVFNLYEMIRKKAPSEAVITQLTIGGWVILLGLMSLGLYNDITRLMQ
ncbi:MAG TPA: RIP metalloprotease RseP [Sulfuricurvum sp.]|nr:MAG: RIP metalloprotease RseP [Campylobacterales bacterium 16-40-21]OZA04136.1 MAG: RIP metalloprotease RseP [Sulfuricurvum sp. 17-40-25]HQS66144.1 RIP metalloprotease RseP [Sulfuricurvum sp.]HQT35508.1 RIP metalloprotease RseP [Sulfuricurvum sp.]